jgi:hypothetical protein
VAFSFVARRSMTSTASIETRPMEAPMTTDCLTSYDIQSHKVQAPSGERIAASITAAAYVLLLPGAAFLMSLLQG